MKLLILSTLLVCGCNQQPQAVAPWAWGLAFQIRIPPKSAVIGSLKEVQCSNGVK
jgi:hypothetical protein